MSVSSQKRVYALRTCDSDLRGHGGFQWPDTGRCEAPDWKSDANCGNGLHGLLNGEGRGSYLDWSPKAKWLVCDITEAHEAGLVVDLSGKIKFPYCEVVHCGDQRSATQFLSDAGITGAIVGAFLTAGDWGTATAGYWGTATAGDRGTATAGYRGTATAGYSGTATAGDWGTATAGDWGTATAGDRGTVQVKWWDGERYRIATGYVGEGGIEANTPYRVEGGKLVEAGK
jgi:hypothetical protein